MTKDKYKNEQLSVRKLKIYLKYIRESLHTHTHTHTHEHTHTHTHTLTHTLHK
jgi:hypothetical protein